MPSPPANSRSRSLRQILFAAVALVVMASTAAQFAVTSYLAERQLLDIESKDAFARLRHLHHALTVLTEDLEATTLDWAQWEGVHRYASGQYAEFAAVNLIPVTYTGLRLDLIAIVDTRGELVYAQHLAEDEALNNAPPDLIAMLTNGGAMAAFKHGKVSGLVETSAGIFLISSQPVLSYYGEPLPNARLIMGRSLEGFVRPSLERVTRERIEVVRNAPIDLPGAQRSPVGDVLHLRDEVFEGATTLSDLWGNPVAHLRLTSERPTQALVQAAHQRLLVSGLVLGTLFGLIALLIARHRVIAPLERMASAVERMGSANAASRVPVDDSAREFEALSTAINTMLEQREEQQAMRRDRDAAIEANRLKSEFLAIMSHEIRTPMNGVLGMCELLQRTSLDQRQRRLSDTIVRSARSLLDILNDILDFSKIEAGRLELEQTTFAPAELVQSVVAPFAAAAQEKFVELRTFISPHVPARVMGDELRLRQVLNNLLSNALKFTERGRVQVSCDLLDRQQNEVTLRFTVQDTGIGIDATAQRQIFEPFAQADTSTSRRFGGTGLGLAIVRRLVTLMNGNVAVESEPGLGSTFIVTLHLRIVEPTVLGKAAMETGALFAASNAPRVLVADDNAVNREVTKEMLEHLGVMVATAEDGAQALSQATHARFDVIFMDCHMPVMDGPTAVAELRIVESAAERKPTYIVALTADVTPETRTRCFEAGMNDVATKPISQARLRDLVGHAVRNSTNTEHRDMDLRPS